MSKYVGGALIPTLKIDRSDRSNLTMQLTVALRDLTRPIDERLHIEPEDPGAGDDAIDDQLHGGGNCRPHSGIDPSGRL